MAPGEDPDVRRARRMAHATLFGAAIASTSARIGAEKPATMTIGTSDDSARSECTYSFWSI
jgi:hypothetical protein